MRVYIGCDCVQILMSNKKNKFFSGLVMSYIFLGGAAEDIELVLRGQQFVNSVGTRIRKPTSKMVITNDGPNIMVCGKKY